MTTANAVGAPATPQPDPVGLELERLAVRLSATCLLEGRDGRVVSHALAGPAPTCVVRAILDRDAAPLHRARGPAVQAGLTGSGPMLHTSLQEWDGVVYVVPVGEHGWLWLLGRACLSAPEGESVTGALRTALGRVASPATDPALFELLHDQGRDLRAIDADQRVVVIRAHQRPVTARCLDQALRQALPPGLSARCTATAERGYLLVSSPLQDKELRADLTAVLRRAALRADTPLCAAMSPPGLRPSRAREMAEMGLAAHAVPGRCLGMDDCRPRVLLPELCAALRAAPQLGTDPLGRLSPVLADTLLAWLDHLGDTIAAAGSRGVHPNTFRYRLKKAKDLVGMDLDDPVARIELHLRLLDQDATGTRPA